MCKKYTNSNSFIIFMPYRSDKVLAYSLTSDCFVTKKIFKIYEAKVTL